MTFKGDRSHRNKKRNSNLEDVNNLSLRKITPLKNSVI